MHARKEEALLARVRRLPTELEPFRELLLANLVMFGEIPAPTFGEEERIRFLQQRFTECGLQNTSTDEVGNGVGILPGRSGGRSILVAAHADTPFSATVNHTLSLLPDLVTGPGVADNSIGMALLATLPTLLEGLDIHLESDLVLLGHARSLGRGNLQGLRFFLEHSELPLRAGLSVEGAQLGRLHYTSKATLGGEVTVEVDEEGELPSAIAVLNDFIDALQSLPQLGEENTELVLGVVEGGTSFKTAARRAALCFQVRSDSDERVEAMGRAIEALAHDLSRPTGITVRFEIIANSHAGGLADDHELILQARRVMTSLGIQPQAGCCSSAASSFAEKGVPALTLGLTRARRLNQPDETIELGPLMRGVAQLIGILMAIDGGCCD
ncbi:MAG: peptidase [Gammaproteobacteria bacterium]|nr:MAG: peptidase [Gammaproteobacteria bacterium]